MEGKNVIVNGTNQPYSRQLRTANNLPRNLSAENEMNSRKTTKPVSPQDDLDQMSVTRLKEIYK